MTTETVHNVYRTKKTNIFLCSLLCLRQSNMGTRSCSESQTRGGGINPENW